MFRRGGALVGPEQPIGNLYKEGKAKTQVSAKSEWDAQASPSSLSLPQIFPGKPTSIVIWAFTRT